MSDDELMIAVQSGDAQAFAEIVERYQGLLIGFFMKNTRDLQFAEDLAQETLIKVHTQSWDYLPLGRFKSWMFRIARNHLIDNVRKRTNDALVKSLKRQQDVEDDLMSRIADDLISPSAQLEQQEMKEIIDQLLVEIPADQCETFLLHQFTGLPLQDVADIMEVPLATSKSRLRLAREKLAEKLLARGIFPPDHGLNR